MPDKNNNDTAFSTGGGNNGNSSSQTDEVAILKEKVALFEKLLNDKLNDNQKATQTIDNTNNNVSKSAVDIYALNKANEIKAEEEYRKNKEIIEFNIKIKDFVNDNLNYLTPEIDKILNVCETMKFDSDLSRKQEIQSSILNKLFETQDNINILPSSKQERVKEYSQLSNEAKKNKSNEYWELVEDVVNIRKIINTQNDLKKQRNGQATSSDPMDNRMFELSKHLYRKPIER